MKKNNKMIKKFLLLLIILVAINLNIISKANTDEIIISDEINYSHEYKKWLEIPDDEKENYIMPSMYAIDLDEYSQELKSSGITNQYLPSKFDSRDYVNITARNQGITDSCWAISGVELAEITYARINNIKNITRFSSSHIDYSCSKYFANNVENIHGFNRKVGSGGRFEYAMAYFSSGKGPILEKDMPFKNSTELIDISEIQNKNVQLQLEDYTKFPQIYKEYDTNNNVIKYLNNNGTEYTETQINEFRNMVKSHIALKGAVASYTYVPTSNNDSNNYFSNENNSKYGKSFFCNNSNLNVNHAICIIGWDDTYPKTNFKSGIQPKNDGAYLVLNSWGENWQEDGCYYISYDDCFIESGIVGIVEISDVDYDNIYQYDELGYNHVRVSPYNSNLIYGANVFTRENNNKEKLTEIGLYINANNTNVKIYLNSNGKDLNIDKLPIVATQDNLTSGYHVIKLNTPILIGKNFSIIVEYSNSTIAYLPIEANPSSLGSTKNNTYNTATSNLGESYYSSYGNDWQDLYETLPNANICIKAFTVDISKNASENTDYIVNKNWKLLENSTETILYGIEEKTTIEQLLSKSNFLNNYTAKAFKDSTEVTTGNVSTGMKIKIYQDSKEIQEYIIVIYGDINGDGNIASVDALSIVKNKLGIELFKNKIFEEAGKTTLNTRTLNLTPSAVDALAVIKNKLELEKIYQY